MANWGAGYKQGWEDCCRMLFGTEENKFKDQPVDTFNIVLKESLERLHTNSDGTPSYYTKAYKCCGGDDAHDVDCNERN